MKMKNIVFFMLYPHPSTSEFVWIRFYVTSGMSKELGYSHSGWTSCRIGIDEFTALTQIGFRPFAKASFEGFFWEEDANRECVGVSSVDAKSLLKFEISNITFEGGIGDYGLLLEHYLNAWMEYKKSITLREPLSSLADLFAG